MKQNEEEEEIDPEIKQFDESYDCEIPTDPELIAKLEKESLKFRSFFRYSKNY